MSHGDALADGFPDLSGHTIARQAHWGRWLAAAIKIGRASCRERV